ncbi:MAG: lanthionine synthetase C family protein [Bacteroidales bacterium]|jgi:lantibiotic modifying enzyme|nr:lanthionine synthetase C family protein [Bacteroidales bacterium]
MHTKIKEIGELLQKWDITNIGLLTGIGSIIITLSEYAKQGLDNTNCYLDKLMILESNLAETQSIYSYCNGLAGIGWLYEYLNEQNVINCNTNVLLEDFDVLSNRILDIYMQNKDYDFLHGGSGIAFYFMRRIKRNPDLKSVLCQFLMDLDNMKIILPNGTITWRSKLYDLQGKVKNVSNISLSHGICAIVCLLSKLWTISKDKTQIKTLLVKTIDYILEQQIDNEKYHSFFPILPIESCEMLTISRLAWCYGDLGIATTLYQAGKTLNRQDWIDKAMEILLYAAEKRRDLQKNGVVDAGLCHGTAGIGHIFYRMWWNTRFPEFKRAADYWFEQTLKMARFEDGLAGYKAWHGTQGWQNEYGLLEGIAGIGLALLTYYYEVEPTWDECLLLS